MAGLWRVVYDRRGQILLLFARFVPFAKTKPQKGNWHRLEASGHPAVTVGQHAVRHDDDAMHDPAPHPNIQTMKLLTPESEIL